jgi:hypothetical protein
MFPKRQQMPDHRSVTIRTLMTISVLGLTAVVAGEKARCEQAHTSSTKLECVREQNSDVSIASKNAAAIAALKSIKQSPTLCIRSFETAVHDATSLEQVEPYFSSSYQKTFLNKLSQFERTNELISLKSAYAFALNGDQGLPLAVETFSNDGRVSVNLEGKNNCNGEWKGVNVRFKLVPESGYWRIDSYKAKTGLQLLKVAIPQTGSVRTLHAVHEEARFSVTK